jgi:hypothetical protein
LFAAFSLICGVAGGAPGDRLNTLPNPVPANSDWFGFSIAVSGNDVLGGAPFHSPGIPGSQIGTAFLVDGTSGSLIRAFPNPNPSNTDLYGYAVAAIGDRIAVGAPNENTSGTVYVFHRDTGALLYTLAPPSGAAATGFGNAMCSLGTNFVVGSPFGSASGMVFVYESTSGTLVRSIPNPEPGAATDLFGQAVAAVGGNLLVGAPWDDYQTTDSGSAYLVDPATGNLLFAVRNPDPGQGDRFGWAVADCAGNLLVGCPNDAGTTTGEGSAFLMNGSTGAMVRRFGNPSPYPGDYFGWTVGCAGSQVLIGAYQDGTTGFWSGRTYLFNRVTGDLTQAIENPEPANSPDQFGLRVVPDGDNFLISAPGQDPSGFSGAGTVYRYEGIPYSASAHDWELLR